MAETLTTFVPQRITLSGTPNNATKITLPRDTKKVSLKFETNAGKVSNAGTDGAAIDSTDHATCAADTWHTFDISRLSHGFPAAIYVASGTASTVVQVLPEVK